MHFSEKPRLSAQNSLTGKLMVLIFDQDARFGCCDLTKLANSYNTRNGWRDGENSTQRREGAKAQRGKFITEGNEGNEGSEPGDYRHELHELTRIWGRAERHWDNGTTDGRRGRLPRKTRKI
jgi:hypothetical protein